MCHCFQDFSYLCDGVWRLAGGTGPPYFEGEGVEGVLFSPQHSIYDHIILKYFWYYLRFVLLVFWKITLIIFILFIYCRDDKNLVPYVFSPRLKICSVWSETQCEYGASGFLIVLEEQKLNLPKMQSDRCIVKLLHLNRSSNSSQPPHRCQHRYIWRNYVLDKDDTRPRHAIFSRTPPPNGIGDF